MSKYKVETKSQLQLDAIQGVCDSIDKLDDSFRSRNDGGHTILGAIEQQTEAIVRLGDIIEEATNVMFADKCARGLGNTGEEDECK